MNNITFTAHLNSSLVSQEVAKNFSIKTREMPAGTMFLYKSERNGDEFIAASLKPEESARITDILPLEPFNKNTSNEHKSNILALCYRLLQDNKQYTDMCAKLAQEQGISYTV